MTSFPGSPRVLKGGIVLIDPVSGQVLPNGVIVLQYNPDTLSRTLKIKGMEEGGDRSEALRLKGPPVETIKLDAEIHTNRLGQQIARSVYNGIGGGDERPRFDDDAKTNRHANHSIHKRLFAT